jgi:hypothetical protein
VIRRLRALGAFFWDFVVGDDWTIAVAVVVGVAATAMLAHAGLAAWWLLPLVVVGVLIGSIRRRQRELRRRPASPPS